MNQRFESKNKRECCDVLGNPLERRKKWYKGKRKSGKEWIPLFLDHIDKEKCIGCGLCIKVCTGYCYEMQEINGKKVAVAVHPENCLGDCSCHLICPVEGGAMVCNPKAIK